MSEYVAQRCSVPQRASPTLLTLDNAEMSKHTAGTGHYTRAGRAAMLQGKGESPRDNPQGWTLTGSDSRIVYTLESSLTSVDKVEHAAGVLAHEAGVDEDQIFGITMAVREAAVNAVVHGNGNDASKQITATLENTGSSLVFTVSDQGKGLDPDSLPDPLAPENLLRGSGRGIFLIRSFMDEVHFRQLDPGTELTLIKHLGSSQ